MSMMNFLSIGGYEFRYVDPLYKNFDYDMNMIGMSVLTGVACFLFGFALARFIFFIKIRPKDKYDKDPSWDERLANRWSSVMYSKPDTITNKEYGDGIRAIRDSYIFLDKLGMEMYIRKKHGMTKKEKAELKAMRLRKKAEMIERKWRGNV